MEVTVIVPYYFISFFTHFGCCVLFWEQWSNVVVKHAVDIF